jgi:ribosome biogenesis GTPase
VFLTGRVEKGIAGKFTVCGGGHTYLCAAKGKLKADGEIYIGDIVAFDEKERIVTKVFKRKNYLVRPYVANIDLIVIVLAPVPEPDFLLSDKMIINAIMMDIEPIICVNKSDLGDGALALRAEKNYAETVKIIHTSATNGDIAELTAILGNKTVCLAGQSAVGKTSVINALLNKEIGKVGALSEKLQRGKHTTRHSEIFTFEGALIIDTSGFSEFKMPLINPSELTEYYADFTEYGERCRYKGCSHISEDDCAVKDAVSSGAIFKERYDRYVELYRQMKEDWKNRFD